MNHCEGCESKDTIICKNCPYKKLEANGFLEKPKAKRQDKADDWFHTIGKYISSNWGDEYVIDKEFAFHPTRKWRADVYVKIGRIKVLIEVNGIYCNFKGQGGKTGHSSIPGLKRDYEKGNAASLLGYLYLNYATDQIGLCLNDLDFLMEREGKALARAKLI